MVNHGPLFMSLVKDSTSYFTIFFDELLEEALDNWDKLSQLKDETGSL